MKLSSLNKYINDGSSNSNILISGRTECWETSFCPVIRSKNLFAAIKWVYWFWKIKYSQSRKTEIEFKSKWNWIRIGFYLHRVLLKELEEIIEVLTS